MENNVVTNQVRAKTPQIQVRTALCSGNVLDKCQRDVAELNRRYQELLTEARRRGFSV